MTRRDLAAMSKEDLIRELERLEAANRRLATTTAETDSERVIHDLHVHQVELEMQNRELREAQERLLEDIESRYSGLYEFAPVGYCTLDPEGHIQELNLAAAHAPRRAQRHAAWELVRGRRSAQGQAPLLRPHEAVPR